MTEKTVDAYIASLEAWQAEIVSGVRQIVLKAAPEAKEAIKWAQPIYSSNGPFAYIKAFKNSVNFGFWRGVDLADPQGILEGSGELLEGAHPRPISKGDFVLIEPHEKHQFRNTGDRPLVFMCMVPKEYE